jgi:short-subunit dehydrogenase
MKNLLVTGATSGLGLEIVQCAPKSCNTIACGRNTGVLVNLKKKYKCHVIQGDITDKNIGEPPTIHTIVNEVKAHRVDTVILCAGVYKKGFLWEHEEAEIYRILNTNLVYQIILIRRLLQVMNKGTIAVVNSLAGKNGNSEESVYCASKFGLRGFIESIRHVYALNGFRIFSVYPGAMKTPMTVHRSDWDKLLSPKSVAELILDLCQRKDMRIDDVEVLRTTY